MGTGYTRNDTANNIADGNVISAAPLDGEFEAIASAFNSSAGHTHDGANNGGPVSKLGPSAQLEQTTAALVPNADGQLDLGTSSAEFKDLYLDGVAYIDKLTVATSNGGTDGVGSHLEPTATATHNLGSATYAFNTAFVTALNVRKNDSPIVTLTNLSTDMTSNEVVGSIIWESLDTQQSGVDLAKIDAIVVDSLDDTGNDAVKLIFQTGNAESLTTALSLQSINASLPSDNTVLSFGADSDVSLTHVPDTALRLNTNIALQFRDSALSIASSTDGQLDIDADTEIEIVAPTVDIDASTTVIVNTTTLAITGATDITGDLDVDNININGNAITSTDTDGNIALTPNGNGEVDITKVDIDSGTVDNTVIGGATPAAGTFTTVTSNQGISVNNGTSSAGFVDFFEDADNSGTNKARLIGAADLSGDITLTLPSSTGTIALTSDIISGDITRVNITAGTGLSGTTDTTSGDHTQTLAIDSSVTTLTGTQTLENKTLTTPIVDAGVQLKNGSTSAGFIEFFEDSDNGTNKLTLIGPAATTDVTLTLPNITASTSLAALNLAQEYTASQNFDEQTLTDGSSIDWNLQTQQVATVTLGGNRTFNAPTNHVAGLVCVLTIKQGSSSTYTLQWNAAYKFSGGSAPTLTATANARDILVFLSDGTSLYEIGRSLNPS